MDLAEQLRQSQARLAAAEAEILRLSALLGQVTAFLERTPAAVAIFDTALRYLAYSKRWLADYHLGAQDLRGHTYDEVLPRAPKRWQEIHQRVLAGESLSAREDPFTCADGTVEWLTWECLPWYTPDGRIGGIILYTEVVTPLVQARAALQQREQDIGTLMNRMSGYAFQKDTDLRYVIANAKTCAALGASETEIAGKTDFDFFPADIAAQFQAQDQQVLRTGEPLDIPEEELLDQGRPVWVTMRKTPLIDAQGRVRGVIGVAIDITAQKAETARTHALIDSLMDAYARIDMAGHLVEWNRAFEQLTGRRADELALLTIHDITRPRWHVVEDRILSEQVIRRGYSDVYEKEYCRPDGSIIPVELRAFLIRDDAGQPVGMWAIVRDITTRKQAEVALAERERLLTSMMDSLQGYLFYKDADFRYVLANGATCRALGVTLEELVGKTDFDLLPAEIAATFQADDAHVLTTGEPVVRDEEQIIDQGQCVWVTARKSPVKDAAGRVIGVIGVAIDITDRKAAEGALRASERFQAYILNSVPQSIFWKDRQDVYLGCNEVFARAVGLDSPKEIVGKTDFNLPWPRGEAEAYRADDEEVMATGQPKRHIVEPLQQADGTRLWIDTTKVPLLNDEGSVNGVLGVYEDITERKAAADALAESRTMLQLVLDSIPVRVFWKDRQSVYQGCNQSFAEDSGLGSPAAIVGMTDFDMAWRREEAEDFRADDAAVMDSGVAKLNFEEPQTRPSGVTGWLRTSKIPLRNAEAAIIGVLGVYEDISEQKRLQEALEESEALFRLLAETTAALIYIQQGPHFVYVNPSVVQLSGYTVDELYRLDLYQLIHEDDREQVAAYTRQRMVGAETPTRYEARFCNTTGAVHWLEISPTVVEWHGQPAILGTAYDITERKAAVEALQHSNRALQMLSSSNQILIRADDEQALLDGVCRSIVEDGGYRMAWIGLRGSPEDPLPQVVVSAGVVEGYLDALFAGWAKAGAIPISPTLEALRTRAPVVVDIATDPRMAPWREEALRRGYQVLVALPLIIHGETLGLLALYQGAPPPPDAAELRLLRELADDIAYGIDTLRTREERRRVTDDLGRERAFLATSIDTLPIPITYVSPAQEIFRFNRASTEMLRTDNPQHWWQVKFMPPNSSTPLPVEQSPAFRALHGEVISSLEVTFRFPDGREVPVLLNAAPIYTDHEVVAAVIAFQDITRLKDVDRAKDQFLMVLSHEMKTPLTSILGWAQAAQCMPAQIPQALDIIVRNAEAQGRILNDLLDVSRLVTGRLTLMRKVTDLGFLAQSSVESALPAAAARELTLHAELADTPLPLLADAVRLSQAIGNLLTNAIKFTEPGGEIWVRTFRRDDSAVLEMRDTGRGIAAEELSRLFRPFVQLRREEQIGGLGLGLSLVRGIIELHGGQVQADSPGPGQGSTFTITLPLHMA